LQNAISGYGGLRMAAAGMILRPTLPLGGVTRLVLRAIYYQGSRFHVAFNKANVTATLLASAAVGAYQHSGSGIGKAFVADAKGTTHPLAAGDPLNLPTQRLLVTCQLGTV
jgi:hypothetical protein